MSRFTMLTCSLVVAASSLLPAAAVAKRLVPNDYDSVASPAEQPITPSNTGTGFAQPPPAAGAAAFAPHADMPDYRVAPRRALDRATVRAALVQARARNLSAFRDYQKKGVFPSNTFKGKKL